MCRYVYVCMCTIVHTWRAIPTFYLVWNRCHQALWHMSFWRRSWRLLCLIIGIVGLLFLGFHISILTDSEDPNSGPLFAQQEFTHYAILPVPAVAFWFPFVCVCFAACAFSVKYKKSLPSPTVWWFRCFPQRIHISGLMLMPLILSKLTFVYDIRYRFNFILLMHSVSPVPLIYIHILLSDLNIFVKKHSTICDHLLSKWSS